MGEIPISDVVLPYIAVRVAKRKRWDDEDEDAEGGEGARAKKHHGRKGRAKHKAVTAAVASADVVVEAKDKPRTKNTSVAKKACRSHAYNLFYVSFLFFYYLNICNKRLILW